MLNEAIQLYARIIKLSDMVLMPLMNLGIRLYMASIFFKSGMLRFQDFMNDQWHSQITAFTDYHPIPGVPPELSAAGGTIGELVLPVILAFGLFTRFGAAGLLVMTILIQYVVPADYGVANDEHYMWMLLLMVPMLHGGKTLSLDFIFQNFVFGRNKGEETQKDA